ncbi:unnamed protein product [Ixodes hexagonus]
MARKGQKLQAYAEHLYERCPGLSTLKQIESSMRYTKSVLSGKKINHDLPCTGGNGKLCQILDDLTVWNEFLWILDAQLQELSPGVLGVVVLRGYYAAPVYSNPPIRHAAMLLHWLLMEHPCVKVLELRERFLEKYPMLFCDALRESSGLTRLKLSKYCPDDSVCLDVVNAIGSMKHLEELELVRFGMPKEAIARLAAVLGQMPSLKSFAYHRVGLRGPKSELLLQGLKSCKNITVLLLDNYSLVPGGGKMLADYLAQSCALRELTIHNVGKSSLEPILNVLGENQSLKKLHLDQFSPTLPETVSLVESLIKNITLEQLLMDGGFRRPDLAPFAELVEKNKGLKELTLPRGSVQCITPFAEAIRKNEVMQKLSLCSCTMAAVEAQAFLNALAANSSLQRLDVGSVKADLVTDFCKALQETGTEERVAFVTSFKNAEQCKDILGTCKSLLKVSFSLRDDEDAAVLCTIFNLLRGCHRLTELDVSLPNGIDDASASALAGFLSSTKTLKDLSLYFETTESSLPIIFEGLCCNKTISKLYLKPWAFDEPEEDLVAELLKASKTLNQLNLDSSTEETAHDEELNSVSLDVLVGLAKLVVLSYTLLEVKILEHRDFEESTFAVKDAMRRNLSFLQRAAQFVMGVRNKRSADAFERVHRSEALVKKVKELAQVTGAEAREKVRDSLRDLDVNFLAMVGVVKTEVVCVGTSTSQLTLDKIGVDMWLRIRSYLKISDVLDESVAECSKTSAKRRYVRKRKLRDPAT